MGDFVLEAFSYNEAYFDFQDAAEQTPLTDRFSNEYQVTEYAITYGGQESLKGHTVRVEVMADEEKVSMEERLSMEEGLSMEAAVNIFYPRRKKDENAREIAAGAWGRTPCCSTADGGCPGSGGRTGCPPL